MADFFIDIDKAKIGSEVFFNNASTDADSYEWNFGDGGYSHDANPVHIYKAVGRYSVTLSAFSGNKVSKSTLTLRVVEPTLLIIEVLEYFDEYPVENASVILYPSLGDWDNRTRPIVEGFTDDGGIVVFADLQTRVYYVDVWEQFHDNFTLRNDDASLIATDEIIPDKVQWFIAWVDYYPIKNSGGEKKLVIKKIEKKDLSNSPIDYETLLEKSVQKK